MSKCLVTKLSGLVNNSRLLKIGELMFCFKNTDGRGKCCFYGEEKPIKLEIVGDGYWISNANANDNLGKVLNFDSNFANNSQMVAYFKQNEDIYVKVMSKYDFKKVVILNNIGEQIDLNYFKYSKAIYDLWLQSDLITGDLSNLKDMNLMYLNMFSPLITGDLSNLKDMNLSALTINSPLITGDISILKDMNLPSITLGGNITGDMAVLPSKYIYISSSSANFTWSNRSTDKPILTINAPSAIINNADKVLNDLAACRNWITSETPVWEKTITFRGTRTTASDNAIARLQEYGYTISVNPLS